MTTSSTAPRQARSRDTETRIVQALRALLAEKPLDALSIQDVATRAGVSVGGFYARFASKEHAMLHVLYEGYVAQAIATADEALSPARWYGVPMGPIIHAYFRMMIDVGRDHQGVLREMVRRSRERPDEVAENEAWRLFRDRVHAPFRRLLEARASEITHPDPARAITFGYAACSSALREALLFGHMQPSAGDITDHQLAAELARMLCAYLGVQPPTDIDPT